MGRLGYERARALTGALEDRLIEGLRGDPVSRRAVLGGIGVAGAAAVGASGGAGASPDHDGEHGNFGARGEYGSDRFDPHAFLGSFERGTVTREGGRRVREFELDARDIPIEIAPGVEFLSWAYDGQVPGPTIRATEGELIRVTFTNRGSHAHTIHPHVRNLNPRMDGIPQNGPGVLDTGESLTYEWEAQPAGVHLYHCHSLPLKEHIHRGLYGAIVIDPDPDRVRENPAEYTPHHGSQITPELRADLVARAESRHPEYDHTATDHDGVNEMVIVMNSFDTNFDGGNEVYAANTRAFAYGVGETNGEGEWAAGETKRPVTIDRNELQRIYLLNVTEFDLINSFHTHSQFF
ncbi:MAG: multicopper oxidase domain-containing protein, partial [Halobacteriales archaeon]